MWHNVQNCSWSNLHSDYGEKLKLLFTFISKSIFKLNHDNLYIKHALFYVRLKVNSRYSKTLEMLKEF
jgi:hypothetical protein